MSVKLYHNTLPPIECFDGITRDAALEQGYFVDKPTEQAAGGNMALQDLSPDAPPPDSPEAVYERKFGKKPHHRMHLDTIIAAIEE